MIIAKNLFFVENIFHDLLFSIMEKIFTYDALLQRQRKEIYRLITRRERLAQNGCSLMTTHQVDVPDDEAIDSGLGLALSLGAMSNAYDDPDTITR